MWDVVAVVAVVVSSKNSLKSLTILLESFTKSNHRFVTTKYMATKGVDSLFRVDSQKDL